MKKDYLKPNVEVIEFDVKENITLTPSGGPLDWSNGSQDSVNWEDA